MRSLILFALTMAAAATATTDASAFGKRKRGGSDCSSCSTPAMSSSCGSCGDSYGPSAGHHAAYSGGHESHGVVRTSDGTTYVLGSDGSYYSSGSISTLGGFATQPSSRGAMPGPYPGTYSTYPGTYTYPGMYRGTGYPSGVYPAGYTSGYYDPRVTPAGYTAPLTMPGVNIGPGGITVTPGILPRR